MYILLQKDILLNEVIACSLTFLAHLSRMSLLLL